MTNDVNKLWPMRAKRIRMAHVYLHRIHAVVCFFLSYLFSFSIFSFAFAYVSSLTADRRNGRTHSDETLMGSSHGAHRSQAISNRSQFIFLLSPVLSALFLLFSCRTLAYGHMWNGRVFYVRISNGMKSI